MEVKKFSAVVLTCVVAFFLSISASYSFTSIGNAVDAFCPTNPFSGDCLLCHTANSKSDPTVAKDEALLGNYAYFCPAEPTCTDIDGDGYALEGGACGQIDCDDNDPAINPLAVENCTDLVDNDCDGLIDGQDPNAVGCPPICADNDGDRYSPDGGACGSVDCNDFDGTVNPAAAEVCDDGVDNNCNGMIDENCGPVCTDLDGDNYSQEGGACGPVDCDDTDATVNPGATENCLDGIDNNCNGLIDGQDPNAIGCSAVCTDLDGDNYSLEGGACGPVDCDDTDATVNPGATEICDDGMDNDCDGEIDEGCNPTCPDADADGFGDAACGGADCDDADPTINPAMAEVCGNGVDENCNGMADDECIACPDGGVLTIKKAKFNLKEGKLQVKGRSHIITTIMLRDADTGLILAEGIPVKGGKWKVKIKSMDSSLAPMLIEAVNSEGCSAIKEVRLVGKRKPGGEDHEEDDDHGEDDKDDDDKDDDDKDDEKDEDEEDD